LKDEKSGRNKMPVAGAATKLAADLAPTSGDPAYLKIRDLIYKASGIYHSTGKLYLLVARCTRRMVALGIASPTAYMDRLATAATGDAELRLLLNEITIGESYMFRHPAHLDALRNVILPQILLGKSSTGPKRLRFWSAGCSTGEEPHTLAMFLLEEKDKLLAGWSCDILATDLNDNSLEIARAGVYGEYSLRNTKEDLRKKYFTDAGEQKLQANHLLKSMIRFERVNLSDDAKMGQSRGVDVIFCCNVLIYFDLASKRKVVQHLYANLLPGGYFFLGHAESLFHVDDSFRLVHFPGTTAYLKPTAAQSGGDEK
jgi:chemotaxis protein methyltransferase CheR